MLVGEKSFMQTKLIAYSQRHPRLFSGAWFAICALLLVLPLGGMILLFVGLEILTGRSADSYMGLMLASVGLPLIPAFGMGALIGPRILRLQSNKRISAAFWGAVVAFISLLLWSLLLEGFSCLFGEKTQTTGGGDVPGAAVVVGYLVVLPLVVLISLLVGALAGVLLHEFAVRSTANGVNERSG